MAKTLQQEFSKFSKHCKNIRRLLRETKQSLYEISKSDYFNEVQLSSIQLQPGEEQSILEVVSQPVGLVVLGQNCWAKAVVANHLLAQPLLPVAPPSPPSGSPCWRMVRFKYGTQTQVSLSLPNSYILVQPLAADNRPWHTVPLPDLELKKEEEDPALLSATLEVTVHHSLLRDDVQLVVSPSNTAFDLMFSSCTEGLSPVLIYAIGSETLSPEEVTELLELRKKAPKSPVFFILANPQVLSDLTESEQHALVTRPELRGRADSQSGGSPTLFQQLVGLGFLSLQSPADLAVDPKRSRRRSMPGEVESELVDSLAQFKKINDFIHRIFKQRLVTVLTTLNDLHTKGLRMFIMTAFDMTWDMMITPRRLEYARQREAELYDTLMCIANCKQDEIRQLIVSTIMGMKESLLEKAENYIFQGVQLPDTGEAPSSREIQICTTEIQDLVLSAVNNRVAGRLIGSVDYLRESYIGTLERCLDSLEKNCKDSQDGFHASSALKQILTAAYQVEMTVKTSSTFLRALLEKMKQLVQSLPWKTPPVIDEDWKRRIASDMLASLSESRLAKSICSQFRERLKFSHEQFSASMRHLEALHNGRLERTEEMRVRVRKVHAPKLARYALESTSLRDYILFGMPVLGREIGRGHYGVVYSCESWAGFSPCAIKSVVPADEKNWNDLAMEFFYTRSIPEHERIVKIRGSIIDTTYGNGNCSAVLLVMERLQRDLYCAIKLGLDWISRLQVAIDVVQGIRFLHSQGLVHRDIKLKNVLLDKWNRAKITDLGFCKPEAMMSGSIVGTPIHMAPELFSGRYDNSVDVYAFGILFWCICAGHVRLPYVFEQCQSKDQLWHSVKKGARPERLPQFDDRCWLLMEQCWAADPSARPLLGDVEPRLEAIKAFYQSHPAPCEANKDDMSTRTYFIKNSNVAGHGMQVLEREVNVLSSSPYIDVDVFPS